MLYLFALFVLGHGLAHMVYTSLAMGWIPASEVSSTWSGHSWLLSGLFGQATTKLGAVAFALVTLAFTITAIGLAQRQPWANSWLASTAIASSLTLLFFWDGSLEDLVSKGLIGLLINVALLIALYIFHFPSA